VDVVFDPFDDKASSCEIAKSNDIGGTYVIFINVGVRQDISVDLDGSILKGWPMVCNHLLDGFEKFRELFIVTRWPSRPVPQGALTAVVYIA